MPGTDGPCALQDHAADSDRVAPSGNSEPGPAYYGNGSSLGRIHKQATG